MLIEMQRNHVQPEWLRRCVRALVDGAVEDQVADLEDCMLESVPQRDTEPQEYLDPSGGLLMLEAPCDHEQQQQREEEQDNDEEQKEDEPPAAPKLDYYGFEPTAAVAGKFFDEQVPLAQTAEPSQQPASTLFQSAWKAINHYATNPFSSNAATRCHVTLASLLPQEPTEEHEMLDDDDGQDDDDDDDEEDEGMDDDLDDFDDDDEDQQPLYEMSPPLAPPQTTRRPPLSNKGLSHHNKMPPRAATTASSSRAGGPDFFKQAAMRPTDSRALMPRSGNAQRKPSKQQWTKQEKITLVSARQEGKSWNAIHEVGFFF